MILQNFALKGRRRRAARALIAAMVPRWPDFERELTDEVLDAIETLMRQMPLHNQIAISGILLALEYGSGPATLDGVRPLSSLDLDAAIERLERIGDHPVAPIRMMPMLLGTLISFSAYSRRDVEDFLDLPRRRWRADRRQLRERLVQIDAGRATPRTPTPLGGDPLVTPDDYLRFDGERRQAAEATDAAS